MVKGPPAMKKRSELCVQRSLEHISQGTYKSLSSNFNVAYNAKTYLVWVLVVLGLVLRKERKTAAFVIK